MSQSCDDREVCSVNTKSVFQWTSPGWFQMLFKFVLASHQQQSNGTLRCHWWTLRFWGTPVEKHWSMESQVSIIHCLCI